jgi:hypothetical protein
LQQQQQQQQIRHHFPLYYSCSTEHTFARPHRVKDKAEEVEEGKAKTRLSWHLHIHPVPAAHLQAPVFRAHTPPKQKSSGCAVALNPGKGLEWLQQTRKNKHGISELKRKDQIEGFLFGNL